MKWSIATIFCCACWIVDKSASFLAASPNPSLFATTAGLRHMSTNDRRAHPTQRRSPSSVVMAATEMNSRESTWVRKMASTIAAVSLLVCASVTAPLDAAEASAKAPKEEPVVEALVQLPDEEADWTKLLSDAGQAPGASMLITASKEKGGKASLGASIAMDRLRFPVMMQLFPRNAVGGANWPSDFDEQGTYSIEVVVCGGAGGVKGGVCEAPLPIVGSGESIFVTRLEGVPEVAESGGMRVPATIILTPPSDRILTPP